MHRTVLTFLIFLGLAGAALAQRPDFSPPKTKADSLKARLDSLKSKRFSPSITDEKVYHPDSNHIPRRAVMHSLMIPGWGQIYNRKWWKVPVVYGGLGLLGWMYVFNQNYYTENLAIAQYRQRGFVPGPNDKYYELYRQYQQYGYDGAAIIAAARGYRRYRDMAVLLFAAGWGIQIIDAYIDAKFIHSYSMDSNLSFKVSPQLISQPMYAYGYQSAYVPGLKVTFTLK